MEVLGSFVRKFRIMSYAKWVLEKNDEEIV
jgi:hypothetical protein